MKRIRVRHPRLRSLILAAMIFVAVLLIVWLIWAGHSRESPESPFLLGAGSLLFISLLIWAGYFFEWTGFRTYEDPSPQGGIVRGKTLWDWLQLIIIPVTLLIGGYLLNIAQQDREDKISQQRLKEDRRIADQRIEEDRAIAERNTQETALQTYLDQMGKLLMERGLSSASTPETKDVARVWTLTITRRINEERKEIVLLFLYESNLIQGNDPVVSLINADLSDVDLNHTGLSGVNLSYTDLNHANLSRSDLSDAYLNGADLRDTDLRGADLRKVYFSEGANLSGADLSDAYLNEANLSYTYLTGADLTGAKYTESTIWPDGFDPAQAGAILVE